MSRLRLVARLAARDLRNRPGQAVLMLLYGSVNDDCVVKANRKIRENWKRRLGSLLYNLECRFLFDLAYWDINGTPKVFPRRFSPLMNLRENLDRSNMRSSFGRSGHLHR